MRTIQSSPSYPGIRRCLLLLPILLRTPPVMTLVDSALSNPAATAMSTVAIAASSSSDSIPDHSSPEPRLVVKRLSEDATLPKRGSEFAAGMDLCSSKTLTIPAGERKLVPTDLAICCPAGTYGRIAPRSGLALKFGIDVGAGVIDADYRGPVGVILFNWGSADFHITQGDRIAQLILEKIVLPVVEECHTELPDTVRGQGGFGSTGVSSEPTTKKQRSGTVSPTNDDSPSK